MNLMRILTKKMKSLIPGILWRLLLLSVASASASASTTSGVVGAAQKPNIIVILADDLGYGDLACYGAKDIATPHIPLHASADFIAKSQRGVYGDTIQELDWSVGEMLKALKELELDQRTLVIFMSDNGPNTATGGNAGPLKGGKGSTLEGGVRVPFIARWPGSIPEGTVSDEPITAMDLLPTLTQLAGGAVPGDRVLDGKNIWPLLAGMPEAKSPHEAIYYLRGRSVAGIRVGDWKYLVDDVSEMKVAKVLVELTPEEQQLPRKERNSLIKERRRVASLKRGPTAALYHLREDLGEQNNLIAKRPEIAERLKRQMELFHKKLLENTRPAGAANQP